MQLVLNPPVAAHSVGQEFRIGRQATEVEPAFHADLVADVPFGFHHRDGAEFLPLSTVSKPVNLVTDPAAANLQAPVVLVEGLHKVVGNTGKAPVAGVLKKALHFCVGGSVIAVERHDIVSVRFADLFGDGLLAVERVHRHNTAGQFQRAQQLWHGGDLVAFLGRRQLPEHKPIGRRPRTDQVQRPAPLGAVETAAQRFSIQRDDFRPNRRAQALRPPQADLRKGLGREQEKQPAEGGVGWNAVGQFEKSPQPSAFGVAKLLHVRETLPATEQTTNGNHADVEQAMLSEGFRAGVSECRQGGL